MKVLDVEQRSEAWKQARRFRVTASYGGGIFTPTKKSWARLLDNMWENHNGFEITDNDAMKAGRECEPEVIKELCDANVKNISQIGIAIHHNDKVAASPDFLFREEVDGRKELGVGEIKVCHTNYSRMNAVKKGKVLKNDLGQIFHQAYVMDAKHALFAVRGYETGETNFITFSIESKKEQYDKYVSCLETFIGRFNLEELMVMEKKDCMGAVDIILDILAQEGAISY